MTATPSPQISPLAGTVTPHGLLKNWLSVTESQICALEVLRAQLPEVKQLMEHNIESVSDAFSSIAAQLGDGGASGPLADALGRAIMGLQFQDRVSQNLVITINILHAVIEYLQREVDETASALDRAHERSKLDMDFAKHLMGLLNLGDLQRKFVHHLLEHGYIENPAALGLSPDTPDRKKANDDIDLF
ncbi:MAG: hypothetical protein IT567_05830 [Alphaproteobacteria bacterium]|nr:hypothetical protein [Alphaproteobacteria bacterium]